MIRKESLSTPVLLRPPSPWAGLQCGRSHPLDASRAAGSPGCSVRRPRQPHRRERRLRRAHVPSGSEAGGRGLGVHVPGPPCKPHGGDGRTARRCVRRTFGTLAGYGVRSPRPSPGVRAPLRTPTVGRVVRSPKSDARCAPRNVQLLAPVHGTCSRPAHIAVPPGRRTAVAAPYGKCGEITYSYRQLQTPGGLRRLRNRSIGHGIRAPGPRARHSGWTPRPVTECIIWPHLPQTQRDTHDIEVIKRKGMRQVWPNYAKTGILNVIAGEAQGSGGRG